MDRGIVTKIQVHQGASFRSTEVSLVLPTEEGLPRSNIILIIGIYMSCQGRLIFMPMGIRQKMSLWAWGRLICSFLAMGFGFGSESAKSVTLSISLPPPLPHSLCLFLLFVC